MIVLSVGGSLISPKDESGKTIGTLDHSFIKQFRSLILSQVKKGERFIIVTGGGGPCRAYAGLAHVLAKPSDTDLHWIGIRATQLNAELFRVLFEPVSHPILAGDPAIKQHVIKPILIAAGFEPGWSSDYDAIELANTYGAARVINLTNVDYIYSDDPRKDPNAKSFPDLSWKEYKKVLGMKTFKPAAHVPFDPVAARLGERYGLSVTILNGADLRNLKQCLESKSFKGTVLHP